MSINGASPVRVVSSSRSPSPSTRSKAPMQNQPRTAAPAALNEPSLGMRSDEERKWGDVRPVSSPSRYVLGSTLAPSATVPPPAGRPDLPAVGKAS